MKIKCYLVVNTVKVTYQKNAVFTGILQLVFQICSFLKHYLYIS